ncbi:MAG: LON peptidase substrate-binding domain-containing protein [Kiloniellales bacterium]
MTRGVFDPTFDELPDCLRVFPLAGALLLPGGRLPLNIFEPRYLGMVNDALAGDRLIGMIQPCEDEEDAPPPLYGIGCVGRVVSFSETDDGRYLITLAGLIRFELGEELSMKDGFRRVRPLYDRFRNDLEIDPRGIDRARLLQALTEFLELHGIKGDWDAIEETPDERLVTSLAMLCPFAPSEKQALLEAMTLPERAETMTTILQMASHGEHSDGARH